MPSNRGFWMSSWLITTPILLFSSTSAFEFSLNELTQCAVADLEWWGTGSPPFSFTFVPIDSNQPFMIKIPDNYDTWNATSSRGAYKLPPISLPAGTPYLTSMSDGNGSGTGGVSIVRTVGESPDMLCLPPPLAPSAEPIPRLIIPAPPRQCLNFSISWNTSSSVFSDRVFIRGWVPGGRPFSLTPPAPMSNATVWTVDVFTGTQFVLMLSTGGVWGQNTLLSTTPLLTVQGNDLSKTTCIRPGKSPSSTMASQPPATSLAQPPTGPQKSKSAPVIAGSVTGSLVVVILASLLFWLYRRRKASKVKLDLLTGSGAWPEPLILDTAVSPSSGSAGLQTDQEEREKPSRIEVRGESLPTVTPMVSLGSLSPTGPSHSHDPGTSSGSTLNGSPSSIQANAERSPQSPQEVIVRHRDSCSVLVELPPLYEEARGLERVGNSAPLPRPTRGNGAENN